ncbi:hypothetical protein Y032_0218g2429 [Ancylostoma ceylanicum]|uniref:Uncharacterized protein n=1 Tax=Ancylostoma ceylanicum TaxID=53326 RepID=A0A016SJW9_9BILA|nr:hypothetical protein Y032_0218g2429 [Ancylostoma ceylanicum]
MSTIQEALFEEKENEKLQNDIIDAESAKASIFQIDAVATSCDSFLITSRSRLVDARNSPHAPSPRTLAPPPRPESINSRPRHTSRSLCACHSRGTVARKSDDGKMMITVSMPTVHRPRIEDGGATPRRGNPMSLRLAWRRGAPAPAAGLGPKIRGVVRANPVVTGLAGAIPVVLHCICAYFMRAMNLGILCVRVV